MISHQNFDLQSVSRILESLICLWWINFRSKTIYTTTPTASKNDAQFKKWLKLSQK